MNTPAKANKRKWAHMLLAYVLSAVVGAFGLVNWIVLRELQLALVVHSSISRWSWQAIDNFSFLLFGMIWLSFVLFSQYYFAKATDTSRLWSRCLAIVGIQVLLLFTCQCIPMVLAIKQYDFTGAVLIVVEGLLGAGLLFLAGHLRSKNRKNRREIT
ncbi:hypothetical protein [Paenibacillus xerothermodurans]|uniref:Uncharacterized protein n=1 Tax=Paenibacillus xerothermodurans TaxID=1977292 RepID=A0A2W1N558_PAEXE|nr:hypothetical protein [Paenibacillus xerothermodurans]PZE19517.1 hypothetical protein CBW46_018450 [Paenibacillus xerothermodurans]